MKIVAIGSGNLANHLLPAFKKDGHQILQILGRKKPKTNALAKKVKAKAIFDLDKLQFDADIYLLMTPDDVIAKLAKKIIPTLRESQLICHCSGSTSSKVLDKASQFGVLYPLQSFSANHPLDLKTIPVFVSANNLRAKRKLFQLGRSLGGKIKSISDEQREELHLAAVMVNNFVNYLLAASAEYLADHKLDFKFLHPLIEETIKKALSGDPRNMQTGPAKRKDLKIIKRHIAKLNDDKNLQKAYKLLSSNILKKYN